MLVFREVKSKVVSVYLSMSLMRIFCSSTSKSKELLRSGNLICLFLKISRI